jgi:SAM-dependent methyltransferase
MIDDERRAQARRMAAESIAEGDPTGWFERLYALAGRGEGIVPWADMRPNPVLTAWARPGSGRALVVGCGLGDDAEHLAALGHSVTAFDVSETAVERARTRFPGSPVAYRAADLLNPPAEWSRAFDLVVEIYTIQVLRDGPRERAIANTASFVAPGGTLLVIAGARRRRRSRQDALAADPRRDRVVRPARRTRRGPLRRRGPAGAPLAGGAPQALMTSEVPGRRCLGTSFSDQDQDALSATSSSTKLVCSDESSVPLNESVTVWPANEDTSKVFSA